MTTPTSPIMEHHVEVSQLEGSSMAMIKESLEDLHVQPGMMQSALGAVTLCFTPNKSTQMSEGDDTVVPHKVSVSSTLNSIDLPDINKELNTYKGRLALKLNKLKITTRNIE